LPSTRTRSPTCHSAPRQRASSIVNEWWTRY